ncbi:MAG TPA: PQQ-binding-like beta-propeller repeat protein, partial [Myxococcota bacterium]|nr:PQQ-binding-like beta-propeller repeat protein [Myxococcota bacterium]
MRFTPLICTSLLLASLAGLAHSRPASQPTMLDLETVSAPGATWSDEVFIVGDAKTTVVVSMGHNEARPAIWRAFDAGGRELWRREHACPDFRDYAEVKLEGDLATCKMSHSLTAVDAATGEERWRFADSRPLFMNDIEAGRVAISIANEELAVLDGRTGERVLRLDTPGAVFQRLAATPAGPFAVLLQDPPGRVERTVELDLGDGPQKVVVADVDAERRMVAVAVGGSSQALVPLQPGWAVPFEG